MKKKSSPNLKIAWKQVFPEDAQSRIERAFEMLLSDELAQPSNNQLATAIDRKPLRTDNEIDEKKIDTITHPQGSSREIASISTVSLAIPESQKAQRKQDRRR